MSSSLLVLFLTTVRPAPAAAELPLPEGITVKGPMVHLDARYDTKVVDQGGRRTVLVRLADGPPQDWTIGVTCTGCPSCGTIVHETPDGATVKCRALDCSPCGPKIGPIVHTSVASPRR